VNILRKESIYDKNG